MLGTTDVFGPRYRVAGAVLGHPFFARVEATSESNCFLSPTRRHAGLVARDRDGRFRTEYGPAGRTVAASIVDTVARRSCILDLGRRTYFEIDGDETRIARNVSPPDGAEQRMLDGILCFRIDIPGLIEEGWFSPQLQHVVFERSRIGGKTYLWRMVEIVIGDPDPRLFLVPSTFRRNST